MYLTCHQTVNLTKCFQIIKGICQASFTVTTNFIVINGTVLFFMLVLTTKLLTFSSILVLANIVNNLLVL